MCLAAPLALSMVLRAKVPCEKSASVAQPQIQQIPASNLDTSRAIRETEHNYTYKYLIVEPRLIILCLPIETLLKICSSTALRLKRTVAPTESSGAVTLACPPRRSTRGIVIHCGEVGG